MTKSVSFDAVAIDELQELLVRPGQLVARRAQLHFALAAALEGGGRFAEFV